MLSAHSRLSNSSLSRRQALTGAGLVAARLGAGATAMPSAAAAGPAGTAQPSVRHIPLIAVDQAAASRLSRRDLENVWALSAAVPVAGLTVVGVTWAPNSAVDGLEFRVRTQSQRVWSRWQPVRAGGEHGPSVGSSEASSAVPGIDPVVVGYVDAVQIQAVGVASRSADVTMSVIDTSRSTALQGSTYRLGSPAYPAKHGMYTPRPAIYSRAQWGANESMRNGFAGYGDIQAAFVHHTVNANDYTRADVPVILRGIYAYHTQSLGWSDVGYNFLVDRFGRIWEGRWGGIRRPVIGAHTLGYNEESFAMSAIGNFDLTAPSREMLGAYKRLFAWKLDRYGVNGDASTTINGVQLQTISGHRDVGATACPGENLYAQIPRIRARVAQAQTT